MPVAEGEPLLVPVAATVAEWPLGDVVVEFVFECDLGFGMQYAARPLLFVAAKRAGLGTPRPLSAMRRSCARPAL